MLTRSLGLYNCWQCTQVKWNRYQGRKSYLELFCLCFLRNYRSFEHSTLVHNGAGYEAVQALLFKLALKPGAAYQWSQKRVDPALSRSRTNRATSEDTDSSQSLVKCCCRDPRIFKPSCVILLWASQFKANVSIFYSWVSAPLGAAASLLSSTLISVDAVDLLVGTLCYDETVCFHYHANLYVPFRHKVRVWGISELGYSDQQSKWHIHMGCLHTWLFRTNTCVSQYTAAVSPLCTRFSGVPYAYRWCQWPQQQQSPFVTLVALLRAWSIRACLQPVCWLRNFPPTLPTPPQPCPHSTGAVYPTGYGVSVPSYSDNK